MFHHNMLKSGPEKKYAEAKEVNVGTFAHIVPEIFMRMYTLEDGSLCPPSTTIISGLVWRVMNDCRNQYCERNTMYPREIQQKRHYISRMYSQLTNDSTL